MSKIANALVTCVLLVGPQSGVAAAADCPAMGSTTTTVAAVTDATTLEAVGGARLRLVGILPARSPDLIEAARRRLSEFVTGRTVSIAVVGDGPDRYGRQGVYAFVDGNMVQETLVGAGLAWATWLPGESDCFQRLTAAESTPRADRVGLWSTVEGRPLRATDPALIEMAGRQVLVAGRVVSVNRGDRVVFVDFGRIYRTDFTVLISPAIAEKMAAEGRPVEVLAGKSVEVRGMLEQSGGPAIRLNDPAEITVSREDG